MLFSWVDLFDESSYESNWKTRFYTASYILATLSLISLIWRSKLRAEIIFWLLARMHSYEWMLTSLKGMSWRQSWQRTSTVSCRASVSTYEAWVGIGFLAALWSPDASSFLILPFAALAWSSSSLGSCFGLNS